MQIKQIQVFNSLSFLIIMHFGSFHLPKIDLKYISDLIRRKKN